MVRFDYRRITPEKRRRFVDRLSEIMISLKEKDQARFFLTRLLTESEIVMLMRRWEVAELLVGGRTYEQIQKKLGVGKSTIGGVDRWLTDTAYEYQLIREKQREFTKAKDQLTNQEAQRKKRKVIDSFPRELQKVLRGNSRMILFRFLLEDF